MRAVEPVSSGYAGQVEYDVHGAGGVTVLLLPTWTVVHRRFWKPQVPFLARHFRVVTYDGPGNGGSGRPTDTASYGMEAQVRHALAVLDATRTDAAVLVGVSQAANWALDLAANHAGRVRGTVLIGPSLGITAPSPERAGWVEYDPAYWEADYQRFLWFFFDRCLPEPHSTKPIEDCVRWGLDSTPQVLTAEDKVIWPDRDVLLEWCRLITTPVLVIHGDRDVISPNSRGKAVVDLTGGDLVRLEGCGHLPSVRDPVRVNLLIRDFVRKVAAGTGSAAV